MPSDVVLDLALMLVFAKALEIPFRKYGVNPVIAYVLAGLLIGSVASLVEITPSLVGVARFSLMLLMLYTGLTTDFREIAKNFRGILLVAISGIVATSALVFAFLYAIGLNALVSLFVALALSNTATETVAGILSRERDESFKSTVVGASFVDDVIVVFLVSLVSSIGAGELNLVKLAELAAKTTLFLVAALYLTSFLISKFSSIYSALSRNYFWFVSAAIIMAFALAVASRAAGLSELIGAYVAGLTLARGRELHDPFLRSRIALINFITNFVVLLDSLFMPIFFVYVGLSYYVMSVDLRLLSALLFLALLGKVVGVYPAAKHLYRDSWRAALAAALMTGRGLLEIVLLKIGHESGVLDSTLYSTLLTVSLITVVTAPLTYTIIKRKAERAIS